MIVTVLDIVEPAVGAVIVTLGDVVSVPPLLLTITVISSSPQTVLSLALHEIVYEPSTSCVVYHE